MALTPAATPSTPTQGRRRIVALFAAAVLASLILVPAGPASAQDQPVPDLGGQGVSPDSVDDGDRSIQIVEIDQSEYPEVDIVIAVPPAFAGTLSGDSFGLTESGRVMATDVGKLRERLEVVVVIDTSGSMRGAPMAKAREAALDFVDSLAAEVDVAVIGFGASATLEAGFDSGRLGASSAIASLVADGDTALYDALLLASEQFEGEARRFIVLLTDGNDTASSSSLEDAADAVSGTGSKLYSITLSGTNVDFSAVETLTREVGGELVEAEDEADLAALYAAVASRLTNLYRITYQSRSSGEVPIVISVDVDGDLAIASESVVLADGEGQASSGGGSSGDDATPRGGPAGEELVPSVVASGGFMTSPLALYVGAGILFLVVAALLFVFFSREPKGPSAMQRLNLSAAMPRRSALANVADRATAVADRILDKGEKHSTLDSALEQGGLDMRPGEFVAAAAGASLGAAMLGFIMGGALYSLVFFGAALLGSRLFLSMKASRRQKRFANQLGDTLMMISGSMRAGHGIMEAIDTVASQAESPTREEFSRAVTESRIGRDMIDSLYDISERTGSEDFVWVVRAISINRELGGDLAEILDNVGETIRDRNRLRDQVRALSAEGKVSAMILFSLPILVAGWVRMSNPEYMASMTQDTAGKVLLGLAVFEMVMGGLWLKKLVKVDF